MRASSLRGLLVLLAVAWSGGAAAEPIVIVPNSFVVQASQGLDLTSNVGEYHWGLSTALFAEEGPGAVLPATVLPQRFKSEWDASNFVYTVTSAFTLSNAHVESNVAALYDTLNEVDGRDAFVDRVDAAQARASNGTMIFTNDLVDWIYGNTDLYNGILAIFNNNLLLDGFYSNALPPPLISSNDSAQYDDLFEDGPKDEAFVHVEVIGVAAISLDRFELERVFADLVGPRFSDAFFDVAALETATSGGSVPQYFADGYPTAIDVGYEVVRRPPPEHGLFDVVLHVTYWMPTSGQTTVSSVANDIFADSANATFPWRMVNGIPPFLSDFSTTAFTVTSGVPEPPAPEPVPLLGPSGVALLMAGLALAGRFALGRRSR